MNTEVAAAVCKHKFAIMRPPYLSTSRTHPSLGYRFLWKGIYGMQVHEHADPGASLGHRLYISHCVQCGWLTVVAHPLHEWWCQATLDIDL